MKTIAPFCFAVMLTVLPGCDGGDGPPDTNIRDYRVLYSNGAATESCSQEITDASDTFTDFTQIYRLHFPDGEGSVRLDMYWKNDGDSDELFSFFAAGTLVNGEGGPGTLEDGEINYAGGSFQESRSEGTVTFEIEGRARAAFGDLLDNAHESYVITESSNTAAYPIGCEYRLDYTAQGLAEQGDDS